MASRSANRRRAATRGPAPTTAATRPRPGAPARGTTVDVGRLAWLVALPCAVVIVAAIGLLGPPLGRALLSHHSVTFWPSVDGEVLPEPTEQARFLLALVAPLFISAVLVIAIRRTPRLSGRTADAAVVCAQAAGLAFVVVCMVAQWRFTYGPVYNGSGSFHQHYFNLQTLVLSAIATGAVLLATRSASVRARFADWSIGEHRHERWVSIGAFVIAVLATVVWLLHAVNFEDTIGQANYAAAFHIQFTLDETYSVLDGRSPLVNFAAQYGSLWPYPVAAVMAVLGKTIGVFSVTMCSISALAMLAMYAAARRISRGAVTGLLIFLPFLAMSFFLLRGPLDHRYTFATIYSDYPMRFAGPWILLWLTVRHLGGARPRHPWPLFVVAGIVALNNTDHGLPALGATVAALLWAHGRPTRDGLRRLVLELVGGLVAAFALVSLLTLLRTGSLPHVALLFRYARLFAEAGFSMLPMPTLGFHIVIYLTLVAAVVTATVRALRNEPDSVLTGALAWCGIFGLGAGSYYAGRSHPEVLVTSFGIWAFTIGLLAMIAVRQLVARASLRPTIPAIVCIFGFFVASCALAQTPTPWSQLKRLEAKGPPVFEHPNGETFVAAHTHRGEKVAILILLGHRIAEQLGLTDVLPYTGGESMPTSEQLDESIRLLRAAHGRRLFLWLQDTYPEIVDNIELAGFSLVAEDRTTGMTEWRDDAS